MTETHIGAESKTNMSSCDGVDDLCEEADSGVFISLDDYREAEEDSIIDSSYLTSVYIELDKAATDMGGSQNGTESEVDSSCAVSTHDGLEKTHNEILYENDSNENAGYVKPKRTFLL